MSTKTKIEWCDATVNPVVGCSKCSPGCDNCYAERIAARLAKNPLTAAKYEGVVDEDGKWTGIVDFDVSCLTRLPQKTPKRIFVGSMCDLFHDSVMDSHLEHILDHIALTRANAHHTFMLLTKRPKRMESFFKNWKPYREVKNLWLGATVCNQAEADDKIPILLDTPAAKRSVSVEPMLGPVDISEYLDASLFQCSDCGHRESDCHCMCPGCGFIDESGVGYCPKCEVRFLNNEICVCSKCEGDTSSPTTALDWVICGGETGPGSRPMHPDWVRSLRDQCKAAGVPFFFKGWGEWICVEYDDYPDWQHRDRGRGIFTNLDPVRGRFWDVDASWGPDGQGGMQKIFGTDLMHRVGKNRSGRVLDGREWNEVPV